MESIFENIIKNMRANGSLHEDYDLNKYQKGTIYAPGMKEFYKLFCQHEEGKLDYTLVNKTVATLASEKKADKVAEELEKFLDQNPNLSIFGLEDLLQETIMKYQDKIHPYHTFKTATKLVIESKNVEAVKLGIVMMGLTFVDDDAVKIIETIALCPEFTLYAVRTLMGKEDANEILFRIAKLAKGLARMYIVFQLEAKTEYMKYWMLIDGTDVGGHVVAKYAYYIAKEIGLHKILEQEDLTQAEYRGVTRLLKMLLAVDENAGDEYGLEYLDFHEDIIMKYIEHSKKNRDLIVYTVLPDLLDFVKVKLVKEEDRRRGIDGILGEVIGLWYSDNAVEDIIKALEFGTLREKKEAVEGMLHYVDITEEFAPSAYNAIIETNYALYKAISLFYKATKYRKLFAEDIASREKDVLEKEEVNPLPLVDFVTDRVNYIAELAKLYIDDPVNGETPIVIALLDHTVRPRKLALDTILNWIEEHDYVVEKGTKIYKVLSKLSKKEVILELKNKINEILEIEEDLSSYQEPDMLFGAYVGNLGVSIKDYSYEKLFKNAIKERGILYLENEMLLSVLQVKDGFTAYCAGSKVDAEYLVEIKADAEGNIQDLHCNCPYKSYCKHMYAALTAVHHEYFPDKEEKLLYVQVEVPEGIFHYISEDGTVNIGDRVLVPFGDGMQTGKVLKVQWYKREEAPYPASETKKIIHVIK